MLCCAPQCWARNAIDCGGVPLCPAHVAAIKAVLAPPPPKPVPPAEPESVVYYVTRIDKPGLVKIGTTKQLRPRMMALAARGRLVTLIGTEPGDAKLERKRHAQFSELRQEGEWFTLVDQLKAHIHIVCGLQQAVTYGRAVRR